DDVSGSDFLDELLEKTKGELFADEIGHEERAAFRFRHAGHFLGQARLHLWSGKMSREFFPKRDLAPLGELEDFSRHDTVRDEGRFFPQGEFSGIAALHETREHRLEEGSA